MTQKVDVIVIGGGPGGLAAASTLSLRGRLVVVVNEGPLMGYGIEGAFRSKSEFEVARQFMYVNLRNDVFGEFTLPEFKGISRAVDRVAGDLTSELEAQLKRLGVVLIQGKGKFEDPHTVTVGEKRYQAEHIIIATGSVPRVIPDVSVDGVRILTSDEVVHLESLPKSLVVLGAGVIGCEFASIFSALGSTVTLVDTQARVLSSEDEDLSAFLMHAFQVRGIEIIASCRFKTMETMETGVRTILSNGAAIESDSVLLAVGRQACSKELNLMAAGVETDHRGYVPADANTRTNVSHIYAVGDVGQRNTPMDLALVHVAQAEGRCAAYDILGEPFDRNMDHVPYIIFTIPMLAGAGLSETVACERYGDVRIGKYPYQRNHRAHALYPAIGFVKLIVGPEGDDRILGVRVVGREADTLVSAASIMIERELPYTYLINSILPHPSLMECLQGAAHIIAGDALAYEEGEEYSYTNIAERFTSEKHIARSEQTPDV